MLYRFLVDRREEILALARNKTAAISEGKPTSPAAERGLPCFYDHLARELEREVKGLPKHSQRKHGPDSTARHGRELSRLGYTVSQVVHGYGVLCQSITELADATRTGISAREYRTLNLSLDSAIADAVTEFSRSTKAEDADSTQRMGFLVHELRNALAAAMIAQAMIKKGIIDSGGSTSDLLERKLSRMRELLDRSFSEVRMRHDKAVELRPVLLLKVVEEVEATATEEANLRGLTFRVEVAPDLKVVGDHNYLVSALSNLVHNSLKYTKQGGSIWLRSRDTDKHVMLDVEDQCGGLPKGKHKELFRPFTQMNANRTGLGLGLTISRQAVELNGGTLTVRDLPGKGCVFTITLPKRRSLVAPARGRHGLAHAAV